MTQADGSNYANEEQRATFDGVPAMPEVRTGPEAPYIQPLGLDGGVPYDIAYKHRPARKGGAIFAVIRTSWYGERIVSERYPATEEGWRAVWRKFVAIDPKAAGKAQEKLQRRAEAKRSGPERIERRRTLELNTLALVAGAVFLGGYTSRADLTENASYDLRFLEDDLGIFYPGGIDVKGELPYSSFSDVQIGGPGLVTSVSPLVEPAEKIAGAALRFAQPTSSENLLSAESSVISVALRTMGTRSETRTVLFIQSRDSELFFSSTETEPHELRIDLSRGLGRIREVLDSTTSDRQIKQNDSLSSAISQLDKAAALLDRGLLTYEEFRQLKSRLIVGPKD